MRRTLLILALIAGFALVGISPASAKPKAIKPGAFITASCPTGQELQGGTVTWLDKYMTPISTAGGTVDGSTITFGPAPKQTAFAETQLDCLAITFLTGTAPVTDQGLIIYGPDFVGLPIPDGRPPAVQACPTGTALDFDRSTFVLSPGLHVEYFAEYDVVIVLADLDVIGTVEYNLACVGA
jgi:hypothetical protein